MFSLSHPPLAARSCRLPRAFACALALFVSSSVWAQPAGSGQPEGQNTVTSLRPIGLPEADIRGGSGYPLALGGTSYERVFETAFDDAGNTYVTGDFAGTIDFDPGPGQIIGTSAGGSDFFAASYSSGGAFRWAFRYGSSATELGTGVAFADGRVFFGGVFNGFLDFGPPAGSVTSNGSLDGLVLAVDATTGAFIWVSSFGGALADGNPKLAASGGRVFVDARFIGPADFDDGPGDAILNSVDSYDVALASYSASNGAYQWARVIFGGTGQQFEGGVDAAGSSVYATANSFGNRNGIVGGYQAASGADFFSTPITGISPYDVVVEGSSLFVAGAAQPTANTSDIWVAAYNTSGLQTWANTLTGPGLDAANSVDAIDGRVYIGGSFEQTVDFDPGAGTAALTSAGSSDAFVALYQASNGSFLQAEPLGGPGMDQAFAVYGGPIVGVVGGYFSETAELDPTPGETVFRTAIDDFDAFLSLYFPDGRPTDFVVTTTADAGVGSLRQAILDANAGGGTISFAIPGNGPHTISPTSALPFLTASIVVDAFSQAGAQPNTAGPWQPSNAVHRVILSGAVIGPESSGLLLRGDGSVVRGLVIVNFAAHGVQIEADDVVIEGTLIGTDDAGTAGLGNGFSGIWANGAGNARIGGPDAASRNVIAGNGNFGVLVYGAGASGTQVQGNFIGTNPAGTAVRSNGFSGVFTGSNFPFNDPNLSEAQDVRIGGTASGEGNLISGQTGFGIEVWGRTPTGPAWSLGDTRIEGNRIGTNAAGTGAVPNTLAGILVRRNPTGLTIGGAASGAGNLVSGNNDDGIIVEISDGVVVEGNLVGTDVTGTLPLGNRQAGILLFCSRNAVVRRNVAGANGTGTGDSIGSGIGGTCILAGFVGSGNRVVGNWVGTDRSGTIPLGNAGNNGQGGVVFSQTHRDEIIGGDNADDANVIAFNNGPGIIVRSSIIGPVAIRRNAVYSNGAAGIDIEPTGRATNDPGDGDGGANRQQNYPAIASAAGAGGILTVTYAVDTAPANATYPLTVDVYVADSEAEEGQRWVGQHSYNTPQTQVVAAITSAVDIAAGSMIVATTTDAEGNTSEFSDPIAVVGTVVNNEEMLDEAADFTLAVFPNPSRGEGTLRVTLVTPQAVTLAVYDMLGRRVALLHEGPMAAGQHSLVMGASRLPAGVYVVRAMTTSADIAQRFSVLR